MSIVRNEEDYKNLFRNDTAGKDKSNLYRQQIMWEYSTFSY